MPNDNEQIFLQLIELTGLARENSAMLKVLQTDVPNLYKMYRRNHEEIEKIKKARLAESSEQSGRRWAFAKVAAIGGVIFSVCSGIVGWLLSLVFGG